MELKYQLKIESYHYPKDIEECAEEIASYVGDHDNWVKPILQGDAECPDMEFHPEKFDHKGNVWQCFEQDMSGNTYSLQPYPFLQRDK